MKKNKLRCKELIWSFWSQHQCSRSEWKDGYCKQHHPKTKKLREMESERKYKEKQEKSPWRLLEKANNHIKELEKQIEELEMQIEEVMERID